MTGFLFDENMPARLAFVPDLPIVHSTALGASVSDSALWQYAKANAYAIVTKDADFSSRMMIASTPPWVIHFQIGNMRRTQMHAFIARVWPQVRPLLPAHKLVNVFLDKIEAVR